jgi:hypothetical protein
LKDGVIETPRLGEPGEFRTYGGRVVRWDGAGRILVSINPAGPDGMEWCADIIPRVEVPDVGTLVLADEALDSGVILRLNPGTNAVLASKRMVALGYASEVAKALCLGEPIPDGYGW